MQTTAIPKNHMDIPWHEYSGHGNCPITEADLTEKASIVGHVGLMLLSCGTGAWRVRSSMNTISQNLGITCSTDIGLMSIEYTCFDGTSGFSQSLCLTNTGVNTSKLNRLERFIGEFSTVGKTMTGEQLHDHLDEIDRIHGLYSPVALGFAAALACGAFTFLLGGRARGNAVCFLRGRTWKLCPLQTDKASSDTVSRDCGIRCLGVRYLYHSASDRRADCRGFPAA